MDQYPVHEEKKDPETRHVVEFDGYGSRDSHNLFLNHAYVIARLV